MAADITHIVKGGLPLCGLFTTFAGSWPEPHGFVPFSAEGCYEMSTCEGCQSAYRGGQAVPDCHIDITQDQLSDLAASDIEDPIQVANLRAHMQHCEPCAKVYTEFAKIDRGIKKLGDKARGDGGSTD